MTTHGTPIDSPRRRDASTDELRLALARMRSYARALEQRCDRLWTYVPDTHGQHDPAVPFVASEHQVSDADRETDASTR
jgi:hypothetical protein